MRLRLKSRWSNLLKIFLSVVLVGVLYSAHAASDNAAALREQYDAHLKSLQQNQFKRPLVLESTEESEQLKGSIYALLNYPFDSVRVGLNNPDHWCDILLLHMNTKFCRAEKRDDGAVLNVNIGKKTAEDLADSNRIAFNYKVTAMQADYFKIMLTAKDGPMGTSDYRIALEAVSIADGKTFIHLTYSYSISTTGRLAMRTYLMTGGSGKVGFTATGKQADGTPEYIRGVRGLIERNTMRYYLAIDAFLSAVNVPPNMQLDKRLQTWFAATERYARQLHEMDLDEYLQIKHAENERQLTTR
jgi:hypothetical protein